MHSDIAFLHAPSIYDFRKRNIKEGPIGDVIPSTPLFEMYPVGFISMLNHAINNGYTGRISNLAVLMLSDNRFDVEKYITNLDADIYGIDLHWLPHVQGAFNIARIVKRIHPDKKVLFGGFSSSYFAEDIMQSNEAVDFILAGDFMEKQLVSLLNAVEKGNALENVPNLFYRDDNKIRINLPLKDDNPTAEVFINYKLLIRNSIKYHDIRGHLPYYAWIKNPVAMTLIQRGCQYNCGFCGGSNFAYKNHYFPVAPVRRSPERIADELEAVKETINSPVFIAGDINQTGEKYYQSLFKEFKSRGIDIPILTEYFVPPGREYFQFFSSNVNDFSCEISPDSSNLKIRNATGRYYSNDALEKSLALAGEFGSRKFDVYFSIGLPYQTLPDVMRDATYSEYLSKTYGSEKMPVYGFISPLAPFLDPGSLFYEMPDRHGYTISGSKIMDYYNILDKGKSWDEFLNYETKWMTKADIVKATYLSGIKMVEVGSRLGYVQYGEKENIVSNILSYMNGENYTPHEDKSHHLTYMVKEIDWSYKHGITPVSMMVFLYSIYEKMRRSLHGM
jgi:B12-binding domain/radical SAM domain protein